MPGGFLDVAPRNFSPVSVLGLTNEARDAVNAALNAMSTWRNDIAERSEENGKQVIDKMAAAAAALGWPAQIVDTARAQMQNAAHMQIKMMDHLMDAWEEQLKLPNPTSPSTSVMLSKLKSLPGFAPTGGWPRIEDFQKAAMSPLQLWMQVAEQWQKSWAEMMTLWGKTTKLH